MKSLPKIPLFVFLVVTMLLSGCYSFSSTSLPPEIRTVKIHDIDNRTMDPALGDRLSQAIREMFRRDVAGVQLVNSDANAGFTITLKKYENRVENFSRSAQVETYKVTITADVAFKNNVKKKLIYHGTGITGTGVYDISKNESEQIQGQKRAIEDLKVTIMNKALSDW